MNAKSHIPGRTKQIWRDISDMSGKRERKDDSESLGIKKFFKPVESSPPNTRRPSPISTACTPAESGDTESTCSTTSSFVEHSSLTICSTEAEYNTVTTIITDVVVVVTGSCNIAFKLSWRLDSDIVKTEKKRAPDKVFQSYIKGKLWILVYIEQSRMTFNLPPKIKENTFLRV